jgi:acyl dehydratase
MNFAAGVDDVAPILYDTTKDQLPVHPMYLSSVEWEAIQQIGESFDLPPHEDGRGVHVLHDLRLHQPLYPGMNLVTTAEVIGVHRHRAGAFVTLKLHTHDDNGGAVATTHMGTIYRDVGVEGPDRLSAVSRGTRPRTNAGGGREVQVPIPAHACHVYSECARIYNAFHTDIAIAKQVGLNGLILQGTGTIARAVSAITNTLTNGDPSGIRHVHAELKGMVNLDLSSAGGVSSR